MIDYEKAIMVQDFLISDKSLKMTNIFIIDDEIQIHPYNTENNIWSK